MQWDSWQFYCYAWACLYALACARLDDCSAKPILHPSHNKLHRPNNQTRIHWAWMTMMICLSKRKPSYRTQPPRKSHGALCPSSRVRLPWIVVSARPCRHNIHTSPSAISTARDWSIGSASVGARVATVFHKMYLIIQNLQLSYIYHKRAPLFRAPFTLFLLVAH